MSSGNGCFDSSQGIRVGFVEQRDFWDFKLTGPFSIYNDRGEAILRNVPPTFRCRVQLENWQPAKFEYQILIDRFLEKSAAMDAEYQLIEKGIGAILRRVGGKHLHDNKVIQNTTEYILIIDQLKTEEEALEFARERLKGYDYKIIRQKISEPHAIFNLLDHSYEKIGESENLIRVVPESRDTNIYLYHVTRDDNDKGAGERYAKVKGTVEFRCLQDELIGAIAIFPVEDYVENVVALNYTQGMPAEAVKAYAIAVRSKALSRFCFKHEEEPFDICNKAHCQVFEGYKEITPFVKKIIKATAGEVLFRKKRVLQAEMTRVCGGFTETPPHSDEAQIELDYSSVYDSSKKHIPKKFMDLANETDIRNWIDEPTEVFCDLKNNPEPAVANQFLPDFRWRRFFDQEELLSLVEKKTGQSFGTIFDVIVAKRSTSGRVLEMEILGADRNLILKGESEIRSIFGGADELPSTCFYVASQMDADGFPEAFVFRGAGSGSGIGLCMAGAVGMAQNGFDYKQILSHYFHGTTLKKIYGE